MAGQSQQPIFHTVITNPEQGGNPGPDKGLRPPPDPGKPSLTQRPCLYLTW